MIKRTSKLYAPGTLPEVGTLPEMMYAWTIRCDRLGEPKDAFRQETVPVPLPRSGEVIVAMFRRV